MNVSSHTRLQVATLWVVIIFFVGYLLVIAQTLLVPFVLAIFLWYLVNVLAETFGRFQVGRWKLPQWMHFLLSGLTLMMAVNIVIVIITNSIGELITAAPGYQQNLERLITDLEVRLHYLDLTTVRELMDDFSFAAVFGLLAAGFGDLLGNISLIAIYMLFLFLEQRHFASKIDSVIPTDSRKKWLIDLVNEIDRDVRTYLGIKTLVSILTGLVSWVILALLGLDFAAFWALMIFVLNFIPNIGSLVATILPATMALVQFDTFTPFLIVLLGIGAIQFMVGNFLEPSLMGHSLNVSPLVIILSLVVWGVLWGIPGMFLCVPITVVGILIMYNFDNTRWIALLMSRDGKLKR